MKKITVPAYLLVRAITLALFAAILGGVWDAWRHDSGGFESVLSSAHMMIYLSSGFAALLAGLGYLNHRNESLWRRIALAFSLVILSAPLDQAWHVYFGIESTRSSWIMWSPPHLLLMFSVIAVCMLLLKQLTHDPDQGARRFLTALTGGGLSALITLIVVPFIPTGPYHVLGFGGSFFVMFAFAAFLLFMREKNSGFGFTTEVALWSLVLGMVGAWQPLTHSPDMPPHVHVPGWVLVFTFLATSLLIDLLHKHLRKDVLGALIGFLISSMLYILAHQYFGGELSYSEQDILLGILSGAVGGFFGGATIHHLLDTK